MSTVLITGTSRGLGLSLVKLFSASPSTTLIFATARSPAPPKPLEDLIASSNGKIKYLPMDVDSLDSIKHAFNTITSYTTLPNSIDILINNAGIQVYEPNFLNADTLTKTLHTNVVAIHNVISTFLPLLRAGSAKKVINITSTLGSIAMVQNFAPAPVPSYKISKAALNMLNAQYALEYGKEGFTFCAVSPGWLRTDLGGTEIADLSVEQGAKAVFEIVENVTAEKDNGAFKNVFVEGWKIYDGKDAPW